MKKRIEFLDYIKAICVMMVIITHYEWTDKTGPVFTLLINMAVPVFMIISGYNFAMSNKKKTDGSLLQMYSPRTLAPKIERFVTPFLAICIVELILIALENKHINLPRLVLMGAYGPGSYYVPIMIQLLLIFPIIYILVEKSALLGIAIMGVLNLAFEVYVVVSEMDKYYYRLCIGRYLLLIAFGCYIYLHPERRVKRREMAIMAAVGILYIIRVVQMEQEVVLFDFWSTTAMPVAFYVFPVVILLFRKFYYSHISGPLGNLLSLIGQASYHIFLIQMVYYHFELGGAVMEMAWYIAVPYNMLISISVGIAFFYGEKELRKMNKKFFSEGLLYAIMTKIARLSKLAK